MRHVSAWDLRANFAALYLEQPRVGSNLLGKGGRVNEREVEKVKGEDWREGEDSGREGGWNKGESGRPHA